MITYRERHKIATRLQDNNYIEADKILLEQHNSKSPFLFRTLSGAQGKTLSFELVITLLEHVSEVDILVNRQKMNPATESQITDSTQKNTADLIGDNTSNEHATVAVAADKLQKKSSRNGKNSPRSTGATSKASKLKKPN